jgi:cyclopropane-fatty-acyl-phospholipid synthase
MTDRTLGGTATGSTAGSRAGWRARLGARLAWPVLDRIREGQVTVVTPDGRRRTFGDPASTLRGELVVHDLALFERVLLHGETGGGEAYMDGLWSSPDLAGLLRVLAVNRMGLSLSAGWWQLPGRLIRTAAHRARRNTRANARRNIGAHYDIGNDFYRLFLDETLTYSSAVFERPDQSLAEAQRAKYRRIAERVGLAPGMDVLEIGSGWGGFALYAAGELGCRVTSVTISNEQHDLARARVRDAGLEHMVDIQLRDYRDVTGTYDAVVSIEMLEAVGAEYFTTYFETIDRVLVPGGRVGIQVITFPDVAYEPQRRGANWIQTYIFPGGLCPSLAEVERSLHGTRLLVREAMDIGPSYARTLRAWRAAFLAHLDDVRALGFDDRFIRMWEYYLALSEAGFATGLAQDHQVVLEKARGLAPTSA